MKMNSKVYKALESSTDIWLCEACKTVSPAKCTSPSNNPSSQDYCRDWDTSLYPSETPQTRINPLGKKLNLTPSHVYNDSVNNSTFTLDNTTSDQSEAKVDCTLDIECFLEETTPILAQSLSAQTTADCEVTLNQHLHEKAPQPEILHIHQPIHQVDTQELNNFSPIPNKPFLNMDHMVPHQHHQLKPHLTL